MEHNDKIKKAFWITEDMDREIDAHLKLDNCSSRSEFVTNALKFYVGYDGFESRHRNEYTDSGASDLLLPK